MSERVVMVGAGYWAQFQVEGWRDAGAPLVAIGNRHLDNAQALAQRYGVPRCYGDVATHARCRTTNAGRRRAPPVAQEPAVRAAIERGIPTICQKPFGHDLKQAEAMTAMAESAGVPLVIHENFRFAPWFRERAAASTKASSAVCTARHSACGPEMARALRPTWTASPISSRCRSFWCVKPRCTSSTPSAS